jgi:cytoplasmic iron level regulating protein YaaA (DUF328/UPF0246 family)
MADFNYSPKSHVLILIIDSFHKTRENQNSLYIPSNSMFNANISDSMKKILIKNRRKIFHHLKQDEILWPGCEKEIKIINKDLKFGKDFFGNDETAVYLPALERYYGDFYDGLGNERKDIIKKSPHHLLILSALYGLLRPFEDIQDYACQFGDKNLAYDVWTSNHEISKIFADYIINNNISLIFDFTTCSVVAYHECINWDFVKSVTNAKIIHCYHQYASGDKALKSMGKYVSNHMLNQTEELLQNLSPKTIQNNIEFTDYIQLSENETLRRIIEKGETDLVEFKTSALWSIHYTHEEIAQSKEKDVKKYGKNASKYVIAKSIAGFLNTNGGNLIIGLKELKEENRIEIIGIDSELQKLEVGNRNTDGYRLMIIDIIRKYIPDILANFSHLITISFHKISGNTLCWFKIKASQSPIFVEINNEELFFVRSDASTQPLTGKQMASYLLSRFKRNS